tara:strand:- start:135 stop:545 length:411 start_codon:yes stop_codon:yes gene_type:complete
MFPEFLNEIGRLAMRRRFCRRLNRSRVPRRDEFHAGLDEQVHFRALVLVLVLSVSSSSSSSSSVKLEEQRVFAALGVVDLRAPEAQDGPVQTRDFRADVEGGEALFRHLLLLCLLLLLLLLSVLLFRRKEHTLRED